MTEDFHLDTHLMAMKEYKPGKEVSHERASAIVRKWTWRVLEEYGLEPKDVFGAVCDGGSDVRCALLV